MKKKLLILILLLSCFGFTRKIPTLSYIKVDDTKIRSEMSPSSTVIRTLNSGDLIKVIGRKGYFYEVEIDDGIKGWVFMLKVTGKSPKSTGNNVLKEFIAKTEHNLKESSSGASIRATRQAYFEINIDPLIDFSDLLSKYGWAFTFGDKFEKIDESISYRKGGLKSEIPDAYGFFPEIEFYTLKYIDKTEIPEFNGYAYQVYPPVLSKGFFPIKRFKKLFKGVDNWDSYNYIKWRAFRQDNLVYLFYTYNVSQELSTINYLFVKYLRIQSEEEIVNFDKNLSEIFVAKVSTYESIALIQYTLKEKGMYSGEVSGISDKATKSAIQFFLTKKGYYNGAFDGVTGPSVFSAIRAYQKNLGVEQTGVFDLKTAYAMIEAE